MKDILVQESREAIKSKLTGKFDGQFCCYNDLNGKPGKTEAGKKILFSTGQRVIAESVITDVGYGEIRHEPLEAVSRPNPASPPKKGVEYVDADSCGKYSIELMGIEHSYKNTHKLIRGILKNRKIARSNRELLKHIVWTEAQDLDLNDRQDFEERIEPSYIEKTANDLQLQNCVYPPTDPDTLESMFKHSKKVNRYFDDLQSFVKSAVKFYDENGSPGDARRVNSAFSFSSTGSFSDSSVDRDEVNDRVKEAVASN